METQKLASRPTFLGHPHLLATGGNSLAMSSEFSPTRHGSQARHDKSEQESSTKYCQHSEN